MHALTKRDVEDGKRGENGIWRKKEEEKVVVEDVEEE